MSSDVLVDLTPLDTFSRFRGVGSYVRSLALAMNALCASERRGLDVAALVSLEGDDAVGRLDWSGHPEVPYTEKAELRWLGLRRTRLVSTLRRVKPRLFHATQPLGTPRGAGVPRVVTCHDVLRLVLHREYLPDRPLYRRLLFAAEMARFHGAKRVIAISEHTANDVVRLLRVPAKKIDVVPLGVDHGRFRPSRDDEERIARARVRARLRVDRAPYFVYVGAADPRKDVDVLIRAFVAARLEGIDLVLAGRLVPDQHARVQRAVDDAGRPASVRLLGFVADADLPALLEGALALAYPSRYEGFGLPVVEAMAAGCPVVTTKATSLGEVVGDAALTFSAGDVRELADLLRRVAREHTLRADLRAAGLARSNAFSWEKSARETIDSYVRALA